MNIRAVGRSIIALDGNHGVIGDDMVELGIEYPISGNCSQDGYYFQRQTKKNDDQCPYKDGFIDIRWIHSRAVVLPSIHN